MSILLLTLLATAYATPPQVSCFGGAEVLSWRPLKLLRAEEARDAALSMRKPRLAGLPTGGRFQLTITTKDHTAAQLESTKVELLQAGAVRQTVKRVGSEPRRGPGGSWINVMTWDAPSLKPPFKVRIKQQGVEAACVVDAAAVGSLKVR